MSEQVTTIPNTRKPPFYAPRKSPVAMVVMVLAQWAVVSLVLWNAEGAPQGTEDAAFAFLFPLVFVLPSIFLLLIRAPIAWLMFSLLLFGIGIPMYYFGLEQIILYVVQGEHWTLFTKSAACSLPFFGLMGLLSQSRPFRHYYYTRSNLARMWLIVCGIVGLLSTILMMYL